jgi:GH35 family endo-1,4-beta-xylanase
MDAKQNKEIWLKCINDNPEIYAEMEKKIETHRKGYCKLQFLDENGAPIVGKKVKVNQVSHDFKYGANIFMLDEFEKPEDNAAYRDFFHRYFNLATLPFYWKDLEPEQGKPRYAKDSPKIYRRPAPELCMEYCAQTGISPKLHCLVYDSNVPKWAPWNDEKEMLRLYDEHIREIAERYSGRMYEFEVINELLLEEKWKEKTVISDRRDILEWAFALCRKHLPNETLVLNESNPIINASKQDYRNAYFMMIEKALLNGATIDKIGFQHHVFTGATCKTEEAYEKEVLRGDAMVDPAKILKGLSYFEEFNLPLEITEMTIPTFGDTEEDEELQAQLLRQMYYAFFACPNMETVVYWNTVDGYCFSCPGWDENKCHAGLFHRDLTPKKAATMLYDLFHKVWHTEEELVTDQDGYVTLRGFYGDYEAQIDNTVAQFGIHKSTSNVFEISL